MAVVVRARLRGRAEELIAATLVWNAIIITPIYVLGLLRHLRVPSLAIGSVLTSGLTLLVATRGTHWRSLLRNVGRTFVGLLRLYPDALALAWRSKRFVFVGVAFAAWLLPYLAVSAYFGQAMPNWDPLWYHDTIVGFTIQNHGFTMVDLPDTLQKVNGYVRLGEMTQLWMVIFADRRLADITNLLFAPAIAAGVYVLGRRYTGKVTAMGWAVAVLIMPACANLLQSTYVDPQNAALLLGGIVFATLDRPRMRDIWLAALGLALALGSKGLSLIPVPVAGAVAIYFLVRTHWPQRRQAVVATLIGGSLLIVIMGAVTYLRNYWAFHNPLWPDMGVEIKALKIHWPGQGPWASDPMRPGLPVDLNEPFPRLLDHLFALPWSVSGMYFDQAVDYGIGITWVAMPLGAIAFLACLAVALRRSLWQPSAREQAAPPLALALILAATVAGSPALWAPRYHVPAVGLLVTLICWLTARPAWERLSDAAVSVVLVTSLMMFWWTPVQRRWFFTPERLVRLIEASPLERELSRELGAPTVLTTAQVREKELTKGKLLVFNEQYDGFPSLFWNNTFSNRVQYLHGGPDFLTRAAAAGATWVFLDDRDQQAKVARAPGSGWQEVGVLNAIKGGSAYRRVPVPPAGPTKPAAPAPPSTATLSTPAPVKPPPAKTNVKPPATVPLPLSHPSRRVLPLRHSTQRAFPIAP
ncbi:MAG TPA: hypothetical protein VH374_22640 [Polyangia bacterium]|nr:hypothetical protein [Polyangia bacterium]